jgi:rubrerythrin
MQAAEWDMEDILRSAIATEWEGYAFYRTLAQKTKSELGRKMFERLAEEEVEHVRTLEQASCAYKDGCVYMDYETALEHINCEVDFDEVDEEGATCTETAPVFKRGVDRAETANDLDALRIAAESEAVAVEHYREAAARAPNEDAKRFFQHLVDIESGHQKMLDAEYDYYAANGFYFDVREFSLEM